ncbi:MAG TPA: CoA transferase, partial [Tepidiformaceae bacterium]|nr:CoA transferase [Tepidiformaceae bacterium]
DDPSVSDPNFRMPDDPRPMLAELKAAAAASVASFTTKDLLDRCSAAGVPAAPLRFLEEVVLGEQARANGFVETFDHPAVGPMTMPTTALTFSKSAYRASPSSPAYGENTREVLEGLGMSPADVDELASARVVGVPESPPRW